MQICTVAIKRQQDSIDADGFPKAREGGSSSSNARTTASVVSSEQALAVIASNKAATTRSNSEVLPTVSCHANEPPVGWHQPHARLSGAERLPTASWHSARISSFDAAMAGGVLRGASATALSPPPGAHWE